MRNGERRCNGSWMLSCKRTKAGWAVSRLSEQSLGEKGHRSIDCQLNSWPALVEGLWFWHWSLGPVVLEQAEESCTCFWERWEVGQSDGCGRGAVGIYHILMKQFPSSGRRVTKISTMFSREKTECKRVFLSSWGRLNEQRWVEKESRLIQIRIGRTNGSCLCSRTALRAHAVTSLPQALLSLSITIFLRIVP